MGALELQVEYRPLRIGWCVRDGNIEDVAKAIRFSCCLWGGAYNPIIAVSPERAEDNDRLIHSFRPTVLHAVDDSLALHEYVDLHPHLPWPEIPNNGPFRNALGDGKLIPIFIDVAAVARAAARRQTGFIIPDEALCYLAWEQDDPLGPVMLAQFGGYPDPAEGYPDYVAITKNAGNPSGSLRHIGIADPIPTDGMLVNTPITLTMLGLSTVKPMQYAGNFPGIYVGDGSSFADVVSFWNLRAAGLRLAFFDARHSDRMVGFRDSWLNALKARPRSRWPEVYDRVSIWLGSKQKPEDLALDLEHPDWCTFEEFTFVTLNTQPCVVVGPGQGVLATVSDSDGRPVAAFQLPERPFASDEPLAGMQYHVVGVQYPWEYGLPEEYTLSVPHVPTLNRSLALECGQFANEARSDLNDIGILVRADQDSLSLRAVNKKRYAEAFFKAVGIEAKPSQPGLVAARVIGQMGGLQGCRVLKIAGVRSLLRKFGPSETFARSAAEKLIGDYDEENRVMRFDQYDNLAIDRDQGGKLTPPPGRSTIC